MVVITRSQIDRIDRQIDDDKTNKIKNDPRVMGESTTEGGRKDGRKELAREGWRHVNDYPAFAVVLRRRGNQECLLPPSLREMTAL